MTTFRISEVADLMGVSTDTVRRWTDSGRLPATREANGHRTVEGAALAAFARSLAENPDPERTVTTSARNSMRGIVTHVVRDTVMAQVEMQCGPYRIVSLMSREAADDLGLEPGVLAIAMVKSTNVIVELADAD
ncbi:TOBE domain-containing protein [Sporichthya polymorpha]|uniref:TOBE domain-containing protein n=1 Tax=Sporichthya polymorpha TaxID=35751 RepID=UPI0003A666D9|nr:helix-turn-helix transcriptional regulator [Sporichthya polymorpha]